MHDTAMQTGAAFFASYGALFTDPCVLEVGSLDVGGSLRTVAPVGSRYTGVDLVAGEGVDVVVAGGESLPFRDGSFELVVSSSCLEHDPLFWLTFAEMCRVTRSGGFIYVSVPSDGPYHGYPGDCWRFYADAGAALAAWGRRCGWPVTVLESFRMLPQGDIWTDNVMVFGMAPVTVGAGFFGVGSRISRLHRSALS